MKLTEVYIETFCHPTEDKKKVLKSLEFVLKSTYKEEAIESYFGPIITKLWISSKKQADVKKVAEIVKKLGKKDFENRIDENGFVYFRLDKQKAYNKKVEDGEGKDAIKIKFRITAYPFNINKIKQQAAGLFV